MTAGQDDYLKFWSFEEIDDVEPEEDLKSEISLKKSIKLFSGAHVISVNSEFFESKGIIFVKCSNGQLLKILFKDYMVIMSQFHDEVLKKNFINIVEGKWSKPQTVKSKCASSFKPIRGRHELSTITKSSNQSTL